MRLGGGSVLGKVEGVDRWAGLFFMSLSFNFRFKDLLFLLIGKFLCNIYI